MAKPGTEARKTGGRGPRPGGGRAAKAGPGAGADLSALVRMLAAGLLDGISDEVWHVDNRGRIAPLNSVARRGFPLGGTAAVDVKELARKLEIFLPDGNPRPIQDNPALRASRGERIRDEEEIVRMPETGELRHRRVSAAPLKDSRGRPSGCLLFVDDITERKNNERVLRDSQIAALNLMEDAVEACLAAEKANEALRKSEAELRKAQKLACLGSWSWDVVSNRLSWSDEMYEIFGLTQEDFTGDLTEVIDRTIHPGDREALLAGRRSAAIEDLPVHLEYRIVRPDGSVRHLWTEVAELRRDAAGRPAVLAGITRDVTRQKAVEDILRRSAEELEEIVRRRTAELKQRDDQIRRVEKIEALGTLAGGIAHDFNNALAAVLLSTEMALLEMDESPVSAKAHLERVLRAVSRAQGLARQIITFSRQREEPRKPLRLRTVIAGGMELIRVSLPATIETVTDLEDSDDYVLADPSQVHQILMNLSVNAAHAMRNRGGRLEVRLSPVDVDEARAAAEPKLVPGRYVCLTVADTGEGMPPEVIEKVFDPFFTTKAKGEGTGLGLSVVHGIVRNYGGHIAVESEVGRGSVFSVFLPAVRMGPEEAGPHPDILAGAGERILLVEDEEVQLQSVAALLRRMGYRVTATPDSDEALTLLKAEPFEFDLLVTDQNMPKMTGDMLAGTAMEIRPGLPVVLFTGYSEQIDPEKARELGVREFLYKPFSLAKISQAIRKALAGRGPFRA
jgi:PAS domain S-box-containing protein